MRTDNIAAVRASVLTLPLTLLGLVCLFAFADVVPVADAGSGAVRTEPAALAGKALMRFTVCAWVRPASGAAAEDRTILERAVSVPVEDAKAESRLNFRLGLDAQGRPYVGFHEFAASETFAQVQAPESARLKQDEWVHLAASYDGNAMRLYVNGQKVAARRVYTQPFAGTQHEPGLEGTVLIGAHSLDPFAGDIKLESLCYGLIDEVSVWNGALSSTQIQALMNAPPPGAEPDLIAHWPFDDGSAEGVSGNCLEIGR